MLPSNSCVYCNVLMNRKENDPSCRTVEHMIPNVAVSIIRNKGEGDFHVCKSCNSAKSRMDELLGITFRIIGDNKDSALVAAEKLKKAVLKGDKIFTGMLNGIMQHEGGGLITIPLSPKNIHKYGSWLAKGQYYLQNKEILDMKRNVISVDAIGQYELEHIKKSYKLRGGSEAFDDLSKNTQPGIWNVNGESFVMSSDDGRKILVCFSRVFIFDIKILEKNMKNETYVNKTKRGLYAKTKSRCNI